MGGTERCNVVVIGGGIAGLSTAIWARRVGLSVVVLEQAAEPGGQLRSIAQPIIDYPGLEATTGGTLSERLRDQAMAAGAVLRPSSRVLRVDAATRSCITEQGEVRGAGLVLATGLTPRRLNVPGEDELAARGLVHRPSAEPGWYAGKRVAVVGGGDRAAENALLLVRVAKSVDLIHRGERLGARAEFVDQIAKSEAIRQHLSTSVSAIRYEGPTAVLACDAPVGAFDVHADACCIYIGNRANSDLVAGQVRLTPDGYVVTDRNGESSLPGVYAVGDVCTEPAYQSLATAAGQAMVVSKHIALRLTQP